MTAIATMAHAEQQTDAGPTDPPVDLAHLGRYTFGDTALETEVLQLFLDQLPISFEALAGAECDRDWKMAAHALKGSGRGVGAWRIAMLAEAAERLTFSAPKYVRCEMLTRLADAVAEASNFIRSRKA